MGKAVDAQAETSLAEAESRGACLHSYSELVHKDMRRRRKLGQVVEPLPGLYARKEYWKGLGPEERAMHKIRGLSRLRPGWVLCGPSAALVLGASVSWSCLDPIEVVSPCGRGSLLGGKVPWPVRQRGGRVRRVQRRHLDDVPAEDGAGLRAEAALPRRRGRG